MTDRDEEDCLTEAFYAEAEPCESCGEPTYQARVWNADYDLWIAVDCSCNTPSLPTCPALIPELEGAATVAEVCHVIRQHHAACPLCRPVLIEMPSREEPSKEPAIIYREAA